MAERTVPSDHPMGMQSDDPEALARTGASLRSRSS